MLCARWKALARLRDRIADDGRLQLGAQLRKSDTHKCRRHQLIEQPLPQGNGRHIAGRGGRHVAQVAANDRDDVGLEKITTLFRAHQPAARQHLDQRIEIGRTEWATKTSADRRCQLRLVPGSGRKRNRDRIDPLVSDLDVDRFQKKQLATVGIHGEPRQDEHRARQRLPVELGHHLEPRDRAGSKRFALVQPAQEHVESLLDLVIEMAEELAEEKTDSGQATRNELVVVLHQRPPLRPAGVETSSEQVRRRWQQ